MLPWRQRFKIHDYSVSCIKFINALSDGAEPETLPRIELDLWFSVDPNTVAFGRAISLLPRLSDEFKRLGVRLSYGISDPKKLLASYQSSYPAQADGTRSKSLAQFLAIDGNLKRHGETLFSSLDETGQETSATPLSSDEGKKLLHSLIRVDFVDAQRNIDDDDSSRSNRLSAAFASFYRKNLEQAETAAEAHKVIDQNNLQLTAHYGKQFSPLIALIKGLGVPSINDRELKIISSLSPETALRGSTELLYIDATRDHELPELYNGLGFKNLIYMAIQTKHFHSQWMYTQENRPLCQLIFIEEPEVHLHAQVQQTFISNIWSVIRASAEESGKSELVPQLLVTTHSSHILDAVDFEKVRYFRRCPLNGEAGPPGILNASEVQSLRTFQPDALALDDRTVPPEETLEFLKRYLRVTHCDLFFADAAILVEGAAETLLLPAVIEKVAPELRSTYLTILEVGGAYAYRFEGLLSFLRIPYLVVTDLDSVAATGHPTACRADTPGARTSNATLKKLCGKSTVADLIGLTLAEKEHKSQDRFVAFQGDITVTDGGSVQSLRPRTLEEAIAYQNFGLLRSGTLSIGISIPTSLNDAYQAVYDRVRSDAFKKTDFAMSLLAGPVAWTSPDYLIQGLQWLQSRLRAPSSVSGTSEVS